VVIFERSTISTKKIKDISDMGGFMDEKKLGGIGCGVRFRCGSSTISSGRPLKTTGFARKIAWTALFATLSCSTAYAADERFSEVHVQLDGLVNAVDTLGSSAIVASSPKLDAAVSFEAPVQDGTGLDVNASGEYARSENQELASLDIVDPAPIVPLDTVSLEVVDTGTSKQVQNPQAVVAVPADVEATVAPKSEVFSSVPGSNELNAGAIPVDDQRARNYRLMLPATDVVQENVIADSVVKEPGKNNGQLEEVQESTTGEETTQLPFAVLLAMLALISMIPVARRNG